MRYFLNKKQYEGTTYVSYGLSEDLISLSEVPEVFLREEDKKSIFSGYDKTKTSSTVGFLLGRDGKDYSINEFFIYSLLAVGLDVRFITYDDVAEQVRDIDGLVLPGGFFKSPADWYEIEVEQETDKRAKAYILACEEAFKRAIPVLGVCGGMQMMSGVWAAKKGLKMHYDLVQETGVSEVHKPQDRHGYAHEILIDKNSVFYKIFGEEKINVNSNHGEALTQNSMAKVKDIIKLSAQSLEGIVEAVEFVGYPSLAIGVQWHPEILFTKFSDASSRKLFEYFSVYCDVFANKKK